MLRSCVGSSGCAEVMRGVSGLCSGHVTDQLAVLRSCEGQLILLRSCEG